MQINTLHEQRPLKIGYLWQYQTVDMTRISAAVLHVKSVRQALKKRGHQIRLVTFHQGEIQWSDDLVTWHPAEISACQTGLSRTIESVIRGVQRRLHLPFFRLFDSYRFSEACYSALAGFDILYERYWLMSYGGLMAAKHLGIPLIYEVNGDLVEEYAQLGIHLSRVQWAISKFINRLMFLKASRVVAVSQTLQEQLIRRWQISPSQVTVVDNGAQVDLFANSKGTEETRTRYGLNNGPVIMFVGSFKPWHGLDLLVESFRIVAKKHTGAKLALVGDGPVRPDLESQLHSWELQERTVFTGVVKHQDVAALLSTAEVAVVNPKVSPAASAQSPLKLFEYMAAGKAIVAPATPNIERILTHRVNGLLVPPDDADALANALLELVNNPDLRRRLGQSAREEALRKHSWDRAASELEAIMYELLNKKRRAM